MIKREDGLIIIYQDYVDFSKYEFVPKLLSGSDSFGFQISFLDNEYKMIDDKSLLFLK